MEPFPTPTSGEPPRRLSDAEMVAEARRIEEDIEARIAEGLIPPRPTGYSGEDFIAWFDKHLRCSTPTHRYFVRERGSELCSACLSSRAA